MDTVTQALLGATIGQAGFSRTLGRRAKWWGAAAGLLPDLDVIAMATHGPFAEMLYHRGFTHSLWFAFVAGPVLAWLAQLFYGRRRDGQVGEYSAWTKLFILALFTHPLIDWNTAYGTQLFAPFSRTRYALDGVGIIDPFYTVPLVFALILGAFAVRSGAQLRRNERAAWAAIGLSTAYMVYAAALNTRIEAVLTSQLEEAGSKNVIVHAYPTLLQPWLRRVVARTDHKISIGWASTFSPETTRWQHFDAAPNSMIEALRNTEEGRLFTWFAMNETSGRVRSTQDGFIVELDDLRYGTPGPPEEGMWGVRGFFDRAGSLRGEVERFRRPTSVERFAPLSLFRAAFGDLDALDE